MVILVMLLALMVAIAGSLAWSTRSAASETTAETPVRDIDGVSLRVSGDPAQGVFLFEQPSANLAVQATPQPTQPAPPTQTPAAVQPVVIAVPTATPAGKTVIVIDGAGGQAQSNQAQASGVDSIVFIDYTVQANDTLYKIATTRPDSSIALISRFGLSSDDIVQGSVIRLPIGNPAYCPGGRPYAVGEGDTAYSVARRYGTTHQNLQTINRLDANFTIKIGTIICVP
ncbi:MAG: LysM peptidoglycan-binding domain-containing protein [Chloroflexota bacterium]